MIDFLFSLPVMVCYRGYNVCGYNGICLVEGILLEEISICDFITTTYKAQANLVVSELLVEDLFFKMFGFKVCSEED